MAKLTATQLKDITAEAKKIRAKAGMVDTKKYKMSWREAIKKASAKICKK